ncbi:MAG: Ig-like domain-containing protein [Gemmatimonadota bacterium]|nr:Ig-like domain-containing protein [Gemmatimonadota bacterium]
MSPAASKVAPAVASIGFNKSVDSVEVQRTNSVVASFYDASGNQITAGSAVWSSSDSTIATVSSTGVISGLKVGTATVMLTADKVVKTIAVIVTPPAVATITFPVTSFTMNEGDTLTIPVPRVVDRNGAVVTGRIPTYVSNSASVSISPAGVATAVVAGSATVTATLDTAHVALTFTVNPAQIAAVKLIPSILDLGVGHSIATQASSYNSQGTKFAGRTYTYTVANPSIATVSSSGIVQGLGSGKTTLTVTTGTGSVRIPISVAVLQTNGFTIDLRFVGNVSQTVRNAAAQAVGRWQQIISAPLIPYHIVTAANDCGAGIPAVDTTETNMMIIVTTDKIDGPGKTVGEGGPCVLRDDSPQTTALGTLTIDTADVASLAAAGLLVPVITHEMGHILGIGTLWQGIPSYASLATGLGGSNPVFVGHAARVASAALGFTSDSSQGVPIENTGTVGDGTRDSHWRTSVFGHELMTGTIHSGLNPLSLVTIQTLADFGYTVVPEAAEDFNVLNANSPGSYVQPSDRLGTGTALTIMEGLRFPQFTVTRGGRLKPIPNAKKTQAPQ